VVQSKHVVRPRMLGEVKYAEDGRTGRFALARRHGSRVAQIGRRRRGTSVALAWRMCELCVVPGWAAPTNQCPRLPVRLVYRLSAPPPTALTTTTTRDAPTTTTMATTATTVARPLSYCLQLPALGVMHPPPWPRLQTSVQPERSTATHG
jgi:hypothetical protein